MTLIAIDVGGTSMKAALVPDPAGSGSPAGAGAGGEVLLSETWPTDRADPVGGILDFAAHMAARAEALGRPARAAGIAVPGIVDEASGTAVRAANLGWQDVPLLHLAEERLGVPVAVGHDVRTGGLAEAVLGAGRDAGDFVFMAIGTGIAAALILNGTTYPGVSGWSGEVGHIVVRSGGEDCACGNKGCLETYASAASIARRYTTGRAAVLAAHNPPNGAPDAVDGSTMFDPSSTAATALSNAAATAVGNASGTAGDPAGDPAGGGIDAASRPAGDPPGGTAGGAAGGAAGGTVGAASSMPGGPTSSADNALSDASGALGATKGSSLGVGKGNAPGGGTTYSAAGGTEDPAARSAARSAASAPGSTSPVAGSAASVTTGNASGSQVSSTSLGAPDGTAPYDEAGLGTIHAEDVIARAGTDELAARIWSEALDCLADSLAATTLLLDPGLFVLGGGLAQAGPLLLEPLQSRLAERLLFRPAPPLAVTRLGDRAAVHGAALLAARLL